MVDAGITHVTHPVSIKPATVELPVIPGYVVLMPLGQGGMGQVFQAQDIKLQRTVALKLAHSSNHEQVQARFEEELGGDDSSEWDCHPNQ